MDMQNLMGPSIHDVIHEEIDEESPIKFTESP